MSMEICLKVDIWEDKKKFIYLCHNILVPETHNNVGIGIKDYLEYKKELYLINIGIIRMNKNKMMIYFNDNF